MSYYKMFKEIGIIGDDDNLPNMTSFDIGNNCQKSSDDLFVLIESVYADIDFLNDLSRFIVELKILYKEAGVNLGCLFIAGLFFNKDRFQMWFFLLSFLQYTAYAITRRIRKFSSGRFTDSLDFVVAFTILQCLLFYLVLVSIFIVSQFHIYILS